VNVLGCWHCSVRAFMTLNVQGNWAFVFVYRGTRLARLLLVA